MGIEDSYSWHELVWEWGILSGFSFLIPKFVVWYKNLNFTSYPKKSELYYVE